MNVNQSMVVTTLCDFQCHALREERVRKGLGGPGDGYGVVPGEGGPRF